MKVLHLHSAAYVVTGSGVHPATVFANVYRLLREGDEEVKEEAIERIGMDLMEAAIVAVYSAVASDPPREQTVAGLQSGSPTLHTCQRQRDRPSTPSS